LWPPVCPGRLCAEAAASPKKSPSSLSAPIWRARFSPSQRKPLCSASTARAFFPATNCLPSRSSSLAGPSAIKKLGEDSGVYAYGVAFPEHVANFWDMVFPPTSARDQELGLFTLICNVCQSVDRIDNTSMEADVCATNDGVLRYCKRCGNSTIWKVAQPGAALPTQPEPATSPLSSPRPRVPPSGAVTQAGSVSAYSAAPPADLIVGGIPVSAPRAHRTPSSRPARPPQSASASSQTTAASVLTLPTTTEKSAEKSAEKSEQKPAAPVVNRRQYPRLKVNYIAMVRHAGRGEEFVQCEDVSRGSALQKHQQVYGANSD